MIPLLSNLCCLEGGSSYCKGLYSSQDTGIWETLQEADTDQGHPRVDVMFPSLGNAGAAATLPDLRGDRDSGAVDRGFSLRPIYHLRG